MPARSTVRPASGGLAWGSGEKMADRPASALARAFRIVRIASACDDCGDRTTAFAGSWLGFRDAPIAQERRPGARQVGSRRFGRQESYGGAVPPACATDDCRLPETLAGSKASDVAGADEPLLRLSGLDRWLILALARGFVAVPRFGGTACVRLGPVLGESVAVNDGMWSPRPGGLASRKKAIRGVILELQRRSAASRPEPCVPPTHTTSAGRAATCLWASPRWVPENDERPLEGGRSGLRGWDSNPQPFD